MALLSFAFANALKESVVKDGRVASALNGRAAITADAVSALVASFCTF